MLLCLSARILWRFQRAPPGSCVHRSLSAPLRLWPAPLPAVPALPAALAAEAVLNQAKVRDQAEPEVREWPISLDVPLIFQCFTSPPDGSQDPSLIPGFPFASLYKPCEETLVRSCPLFLFTL